jgi:hypothetical protein
MEHFFLLAFAAKIPWITAKQYLTPHQNQGKEWRRFCDFVVDRGALPQDQPAVKSTKHFFLEADLFSPFLRSAQRNCVIVNIKYPMFLEVKVRGEPKIES